MQANGSVFKQYVLTEHEKSTRRSTSETYIIALDSHCSFFVICIHVPCPLRCGHSEGRLLPCRIGPVDVLVALVPRPGSEGELQVYHSSRALLPAVSFLLVVLHLIPFQHEPSLLPSLVVATCRGSKHTHARISLAQSRQKHGLRWLACVLLKLTQLEQVS